MKDKVYVLLAGVNGAGKSTFYNTFDVTAPLFPFCDSATFANLPSINPDNLLKTFGHWADYKNMTAGLKLSVSKTKDESL